MQNSEGLNLEAKSGASIVRAASIAEVLRLHGRYDFECVGPIEERRSEYIALGERLLLCNDDDEAIIIRAARHSIPREVKWRDVVHNLVTDVGAKHMEDNYLAASAFTQTGPFLGLISSVGYTTGAAVGDTMASHGGWNEAGNGVNYPNWSTPASNARGTCSFSAASGSGAGNRVKALSSAISFVIATNGGTLKGSFIVLGASAVSTNNSTAGTLFSAGTFSGGDKVVQIADTLNASWQLGM